MFKRPTKGIKQRPCKKVVYDNITFDSGEECRRYQELKRWEGTGYIKDLTVHPKFILQPSFKKNGKRIQAITYTADFKYYELGGGGLWTWIVEDKKPWNVKHQKFIIEEPARLRHKMFEFQHPDIIFRITR